MKQTSTTKTLDISKGDAPALSQAHFDRAEFRVGKQNVSRGDWQKAVRGRIAKQRISKSANQQISESALCSTRPL
jgi:hypothetical protein